jgi:hypothetical protein
MESHTVRMAKSNNNRLRSSGLVRTERGWWRPLETLMETGMRYQRLCSMMNTLLKIVHSNS